MLRSGRTFPYALLMPATIAHAGGRPVPARLQLLARVPQHEPVSLPRPFIRRARELPAHPAEPVFYTLLLKSVTWTVVNVFFHVVLGVLLAVLLNGPVPARR